MSIVLFFKKNVFKKVVKLMGEILPKRLFNIFYNLFYFSYRKLIIFVFSFSNILVYKWGNKETYKMRKEILSILPYTMVGIDGLMETYRLCNKINQRGILGDFVELGIAKGGCAALMGSTVFNDDNLNHRNLLLFDSFEGLPEPTEEDFKNNKTGDHVRPLSKGACLGTLDEVQHLMFDIKQFPKGRVKFIKGWFNNTIPLERKNIDKIAILRIDGDWYESVKTCLEGLYDKVSAGGVVISDDYQSCYGAEKAVNEFIEGNKLNVKVLLDKRGGCYWYKN